MTTNFQDEHLWAGHLGQFFIILSFGSAVLAAISYYFSATQANKLDNSWFKLGRWSFFVNTFSVVAIGCCLFYIIYNNLFEYHYAWAHSSRTLPVYYIISSYWEGQEGSFWLWTFWQALLGNILIWRAKTWERPVMAIISLSQALLTSMLIGVEVLGTRVGSSPFILLRDAIEGPIFGRPDYMQYVKDGNGLNPLLQNYWMVIHPPTLFLGFASMIVPFAYAVAGLWQRRYKEWVSAAIPYALFAVMILGTGIIMGSFWAYESLNFGGFWNWDPVENASLIPWLVLIAAVHVMIVFKNTGHSYFTATLLTLLSFVLVLYASFLTRSGILGETSVHSFTDLGMFWHLVIDVLIFLAITVGVLIWRWKELPFSKKEEETYSREFWVFVGSAFLALSCLQLVVVTSVPVWNAMFKTNIAPPANPITLYNIFQAGFAVVVTLFLGFTQFLKYKKTDAVRFYITTGLYLFVAALITGVVIYITGLYKLKLVFSLAMFGAVYGVLANGKILADALKGKFKLAGSAVAHIGFALLLVGALVAAGTSKVVSQNETGIIQVKDFDKAGDARENIMLYKNQPVEMGGYRVTYVGDSLVAPNHYFKVDYKKFDEAGKLVEHFVLKPNSQANAKMGLVSSPDTKHYLFHDLYTHITAAPIKEEEGLAAGSTEIGHSHDAAEEDKHYNPPVVYQASLGDTIRFREGFIVFTGINKSPKLQNIPLTENDVAVGAQLKIESHGVTYQAEPVFMIKGGNSFDFAKKVDDAGLKLRFSKIIPAQNKFELMVYQQPESQKSYVVMRAINFPYINFFWAGTIIMVIGFVMSIVRRNSELKEVPVKPVKAKAKASSLV
jgi:cytochrome c-type biogenesis protein CcmF